MPHDLEDLYGQAMLRLCAKERHAPALMNITGRRQLGEYGSRDPEINRRRRRVLELSMVGLSRSQIALATGVNASTVQADLLVLRDFRYIAKLEPMPDPHGSPPKP